MNYAEIREVDTANCKGVGASIFVSGCRHHCEGCFQSELWDFDYGKEFDQSDIDKIISFMSKSYVHSFSFLGGDPFEPENIGECTRLAVIIRQRFPDKVLYAWSGYLFDELLKREDCKIILNTLDYLIDGEFKLERKRLDLHLMGSDNQRIIDVKASIKANDIITVSYEDIKCSS